MQISLTNPEPENYLDAHVKNGRFASPADVVETAIARLMLEPEGVETFAEDRLASQHPEQKIVVPSDCQCFCTTIYRNDLPHMCWRALNGETRHG